MTMLRLLPALCLLLLAGACGPPQVPVGSDRSALFAVEVGGVPAMLHLALTPEEQAEGLMHRGKLGRNEGMLFVYPDAARRSFWMLNTMIPLDLGHFDSNGILLEVLPLRPNDTTTVYSASREVKFSLEMNRGWFRENAVEPGARIALGQIGRAVRARGWDPQRFDLSP